MGSRIERKLLRQVGKASKDFGAPVRFAADANFCGAIAAAFLCNHHKSPLASANDRFRRNQQRLTSLRCQCDLREHARFEPKP